MSALIVGTSILDVGTIVVMADRLDVNGVQYPFTVIPGYLIIDSPAPPADWVPSKYLFQGGAFVANQAYVPPSPPVPQSVSRFQALAALSNAGLLTQAQTAVNAASLIVQLAWANAQEFERSSPTIASLAGALNLNSAQIDALFIAAAQIQA